MNFFQVFPAAITRFRWRFFIKELCCQGQAKPTGESCKPFVEVTTAVFEFKEPFVFLRIGAVTNW